tara:strand:- start:1059 stop:2318 length:1260 start_codon:yes stop_codon:yes gene_type:complete
MIITLFIVFFVLIIIGTPIAFALLISSTAAIYFFSHVPLLIVVQRVFTGLDVFALMAIPLFLFAGYLMTAIKISDKLIALASIFLGRYRGGLSLVTTGSSAVFGAISGSANATTAAIGSVMIPSMQKKGYDQAFSAAVVSSSGVLGLIVPPSITMVLFGVSAGVSIGGLFLNGIVPAIIIAAGIMIINYVISCRRGYGGEQPLDFSESMKVIKSSAVALAMPIIILGGIYAGIFTPTESAAVACAYGLLVGIFFYRNLTFTMMLEISKKTIKTTSVILFLIGSASVFTYVLASENVPRTLALFIIDLSDNPIVIMFLLLGLLLVLGTFLDNVAAVVLLTPTLMPVINFAGIDPMFFGVFMVIAVAVGQITPPVGLNLFIATNLTDRKLEEVVRASLPYFAFYVVLLSFFIIFPGLLTVF